MCILIDGFVSIYVRMRKVVLTMNNRNLIIVGAGAYADVAFEIASDMSCFDRIDFVDDNKKYRFCQ